MQFIKGDYRWKEFHPPRNFIRFYFSSRSRVRAIACMHVCMFYYILYYILYYNDNRKSKFKGFRQQIYDLQTNFMKKFVDFCCNDIVPKILLRILDRLKIQPRKDNSLFHVLISLLWVILTLGVSNFVSGGWVILTQRHRFLEGDKILLRFIFRVTDVVRRLIWSKIKSPKL